MNRCGRGLPLLQSVAVVQRSLGGCHHHPHIIIVIHHLEWPALVMHWGEVQGCVVDKNLAWTLNHILSAHRPGQGQ